MAVLNSSLISEWTKVTMSGLMGALKTAGRVTLVPEDSPFSLKIDISGLAACNKTINSVVGSILCPWPNWSIGCQFSMPVS